MFNEFHYQVRGRGHEQDGTRGQDRTAYLSRRGVQVLCLADGAGSATYSEYGAQAVVEEGCALLAEHFADLVASGDAEQSRREILERLRARLGQVAARLDCSVADLASTFLAVAVSADRFIVIHIGDGVIGYIKHGDLRVISTPDNDEFANQTTFVTSANVSASTRLSRGAWTGYGLYPDERWDEREPLRLPRQDAGASLREARRICRKRTDYPGEESQIQEAPAKARRHAAASGHEGRLLDWDPRTADLMWTKPDLHPRRAGGDIK